MGELSSITLKDGCLGFSKFLFSLFVIFSHVWRCCISLYPPLKRLCWKTYFSLLGSCLGHNNVGDKEWGGNNEAATSTGLLILVFGTLQCLERRGVVMKSPKAMFWCMTYHGRYVREPTICQWLRHQPQYCLTLLTSRPDLVQALHLWYWVLLHKHRCIDQD